MLLLLNVLRVHHAGVGNLAGWEHHGRSDALLVLLGHGEGLAHGELLGDWEGLAWDWLLLGHEGSVHHLSFLRGLILEEVVIEYIK